MKGYKVFDKDLKCRDFQYEIGKEYKLEGALEICENGFHFCEKVADCFNYYDFDTSNRIAEVEARGEVKTEGDKSVTNNIVIIKELTWSEMLDIANIGKNNNGLSNTGDWNTGNSNTGNRNTGNSNTGDWNTGNRNTGNRNTGYSNTGYGNTGNWNTGNWNTGHWNTGYWNITNRSTGILNTEETTILIFDKNSNLTFEQAINSKWYNILKEFSILKLDERDIEISKENQQKWNKMLNEYRQLIFDIPNFDKEKFKKITGIEV